MQSSGSPGDSLIQPDQIQDNMGPLTIIGENMTDTEMDRTIDDAKNANKELHIKDMNGKETQISTKHSSGVEDDTIDNKSEISELELLSNLGSSTEIEHDTEENNLRSSRRLTKTNPIVRLNNPVPSDNMKFRQKVEQLETNNKPGKQPGVRWKPEFLKNRPLEWTVQDTDTNRTIQSDLTRTSAVTTHQLWTEHRHKKNWTSPIGQLSSNRVLGSEVCLEDKL